MYVVWTYDQWTLWKICLWMSLVWLQQKPPRKLQTSPIPSAPRRRSRGSPRSMWKSTVAAGSCPPALAALLAVNRKTAYTEGWLIGRYYMYAYQSLNCIIFDLCGFSGAGLKITFGLRVMDSMTQFWCQKIVFSRLFCVIFLVLANLTDKGQNQHLFDFWSLTTFQSKPKKCSVLDVLLIYFAIDTLCICV